MSNISRRSFLKGAGVAALAVAAAGVLAGCSDKETPDTGAKRDVKLKYGNADSGGKKQFNDSGVTQCIFLLVRCSGKLPLGVNRREEKF